jgi:hypothetical protein
MELPYHELTLLSPGGAVGDGADESASKGGGVLLKVREGSVYEHTPGNMQTMANEHTGFYVWGAALVLAQWLASTPALLAEMEGVDVYELGAGCGVPGLAAALAGRPRRVVLTDLAEPAVMATLRHNATLNQPAAPHCALEACELDWTHAQLPLPPAAVVLGADLIYSESTAALLAPVVRRLVLPGGIFVHAYPFTMPSPLREGVDEFADALCAEGFTLEADHVAPEPLLADPTGGAAGSRFHQLLQQQFRLQRYRRRQ